MPSSKKEKPKSGNSSKTLKARILDILQHKAEAYRLGAQLAKELKKSERETE